MPHRPTLIALVLLIAASASASAQTESILHQFVPFANGYYPESNLVPDSQGNFYGTTYEGGAYGWGTVYRLSPNKNGTWTQTVLHSFQSNGTDGILPVGSIVVDSASNIYGVTQNGAGTGHFGVVYELSPSNASWTETILYTFDRSASEPVAGLVADASGNLYGSTLGLVFELSLTSTGWIETPVHKFSGRTPDCGSPGQLSIDAAGNLYGVSVTEYDPNHIENFGDGCAVLFELSPTTAGQWNFTAVRNFTGQIPSSNLVIDAQGNVYGAKQDALFKLIKGPDQTWVWKLLSNLQLNNQSVFLNGIALDAQGNLYGSAYGRYVEGEGCYPGCGAIIEFSPNQAGTWTANTLYSFQGNSDGSNPSAPVFIDPSGKLYGPTSLSGISNAGTIFQLSPSSTGTWTEQQLYVFPSTDGNYVSSGLASDGAGNYYGTTSLGGTDQCNNGGLTGCGIVFKMSQNSQGQWQEIILYNFTGLNGDASSPDGTPVLDAAGNLYGVTSIGGAHNRGAVYELSPSTSGTWIEKVIYSFGANSTDGEGPTGTLLFDAFGNLYGVTAFGGRRTCGTAFELTPSTTAWTETILYNFQNGNDGCEPTQGLTMDASGNLYGTDLIGPVNSRGVAFKLSPNGTFGWTLHTLHTFPDSTSDGEVPASPLLFDGAGNLYGVTVGGGTSSCQCGTVFELSPTSSGPWKETILYAFSGAPDGYYPGGKLAFDPFGNLYGSTAAGGSANPYCGGTVFELTPTSTGYWSESLLHSFAGFPSDGCAPTGVLLDPTGIVFGATQGGGIAGSFYEGGGTVFQITP